MTYEFEYRVAFARFCAKYPDLELESNPFIDLPENQGFDMPADIPFNDSLETLPN